MKRRRLVSRFARARRTARGTWLPITLRWRRSPGRRERMAPGRLTAVMVTGSAWVAHLHLRFAAASPGRTIHREAIWRNAIRHKATAIHHAGAVTTLRHTASSSSQRVVLVRGGHRSVREVHDARTVTTSPDARSPLFPRQAARAGRHSLREFHHRSAAATHTRTHSSSDRRLRETRVFRTFHARSHSHHARTVLREPFATPAPFVPPAQLVWHRESSSPAAAAQASQESRRVDHVVAASRHSAVHDLRGESFAQTARAALQADSIDPALLDRLTDDVIRRVERRARIERERRGL